MVTACVEWDDGERKWATAIDIEPFGWSRAFECARNTVGESDPHDWRRPCRAQVRAKKYQTNKKLKRSCFPVSHLM